METTTIKLQEETIKLTPKQKKLIQKRTELIKIIGEFQNIENLVREKKQQYLIKLNEIKLF